MVDMGRVTQPKPVCSVEPVCVVSPNSAAGLLRMYEFEARIGDSLVQMADSDALPLSGEVALVTGASRGIGRAIALELASQGADIGVNYTASSSAAEEVAEQIRGLGRQAVVAQADISDGDAVSAMTKAVTGELGTPTILINNAGITRDMLAMRMKSADWEAVVGTNLTGSFLTTQSVLRGMLRARKGRIITIGSVIGTVGNAGQANYAAAKAGLAGMTRSLAHELGSRGITVNLVAPGFIQTDITADLSDEVIGNVMQRIPLERLGDPADVAPLVAFLAGPGGAYITGQIIHVDGGMVMG